MTLAPLPPYALATPVFPFRHLVGLAGRAPIGGVREVALACFIAARLAADVTAGNGEAEGVRTTRCAGAKAWLGTLALPAPVRASVSRCADVSGSGSREELSKELASLASAATNWLDTPARHEIETLAASLRA